MLALTYWILPIRKTIGPVVWIATNHGNESIADESQHEEDLEHGQIKLGSSKVPDCKPVETTN